MNSPVILGVLPTLAPVTPFIPSVGDILQTTISFKNGDRLKIIDGPNVVDSIGPDYFESLTFYFKSSGLYGGGTTETTSVSYENLLGDLLPDPNGTSTGVLGQTIPTPNSTNTFISFTGLTLTTRIDGLGVSDPFDQFGLFGGRAGGYEVIPGMIPEPPTYALLGLGFAVSGISMYRRVSKRPASKPAQQPDL